MNKKISVVIWDPTKEKFLVFNKQLPCLYTSEIKMFDIAVKIIELQLNAACCFMSPMFVSDEEEVWQALEVLYDDEYWIENNVNFEWLTLEEFEARVKKVHAGTKYEREYMALIELAKAKFEL